MKNLLLILILFLFSCEKEQYNTKTTIESLSIEFLNTTDQEDLNFNMYDNGVSTGIEFGCQPSVLNKIEVGHIYTIKGTNLITHDTIATLILTDQGEFIINNNPNIDYAQLRYGYTCVGKGIKIWD